MNLEEVKILIKENLKIKITTDSSGSECSYNEKTYVQLIFDEDIISEIEIEKLGEDH